MKVGIVGLPNAGKSSLFNALTRAGAEAANYPFTTIEPNVAVVPVPSLTLGIGLGVVPGSLVAFGATIHVQGPAGTRDIPAVQFFTLPKVDIARENVLAREEVIASVSVPAWEGARSYYLEGREKESFDWSLVNATAVLKLEGDVCKEARIVLGSVAPVPRRVEAAEKALVGKKIDEAAAAEAARVAFADATPLAGNAYKVSMGRVIAKRAILAAAGLWKE